MPVLFIVPFAPWAASLVCLGWLFAARSKAALVFTVACSTVALLVWAWLDWSFRDGLGPGSVPSYGSSALRNFFGQFWLALAVWWLLAVVSLALYQRGRSRGPA
jgi:hypothetical protein